MVELEDELHEAVFVARFGKAHITKYDKPVRSYKVIGKAFKMSETKVKKLLGIHDSKLRLGMDKAIDWGPL